MNWSERFLKSWVNYITWKQCKKNSWIRNSVRCVLIGPWCSDLSHNQLTGFVPTNLAQLQNIIEYVSHHTPCTPSFWSLTMTTLESTSVSTTFWATFCWMAFPFAGCTWYSLSTSHDQGTHLWFIVALRKLSKLPALERSRLVLLLRSMTPAPTDCTIKYTYSYKLAFLIPNGCRPHTGTGNYACIIQTEIQL